MLFALKKSTVFWKSSWKMTEISQLLIFFFSLLLIIIAVILVTVKFVSEVNHDFICNSSLVTCELLLTVLGELYKKSLMWCCQRRM